MRESVVIVGGGIAGLSLALQAAEHFEVTVLEMEFQPGYHSTGRSAAVLHIPFENDVVHRLTLASVEFFRSPPTGFAGIAQSLSTLRIGRNSDQSKIEQFLDTWIERCPWLEQLTQDQILAKCPIVSNEFTRGVMDNRSLSLDVNQLLACTRRALKEFGVRVETNFRVNSIENVRDSWNLTSDHGSTVSANILVNAAGAWLDEVAILAGIRPLGVQAKRRTGIRCRPSIFSSSWPMCYLINHELYFKPEGRSLMLSPCDKTPSDPCDAQPELIDVARAIALLEENTELSNVAPEESWAGLRVFVPDQFPVIGYDDTHPNFFWYGAFGGFGVQTAPSCSKLGAKLLRHEAHNDSLVNKQEVSPNRMFRPV